MRNLSLALATLFAFSSALATEPVDQTSQGHYGERTQAGNYFYMGLTDSGEKVFRPLFEFSESQRHEMRLCNSSLGKAISVTIRTTLLETTNASNGAPLQLPVSKIQRVTCVDAPDFQDSWFGAFFDDIYLPQ